MLGKLNNDAFTDRLVQMIDDVKNEALLKEANETLTQNYVKQRSF